MTSLRNLLCGVSVLALAACAARGTPPPEITYDSGYFMPAAVEPEPSKPVEIVAVPEPLPLPGQLKSAPKGEPAAPDKRPPTDRVDDANDAARLEPTENGYINAVQVYPFTKGALYRLYASPEQVSDIALQPGEKLIAVSAGDTVRWVVGDTTSGAGERQQVHVLVKPVAPDLRTNLVITTDRRAYHLELESTEETYMASVSWHYPHEELVALRRQNERASEVQSIAERLTLDRLRFRYEIAGDNPPWRPLRAFDDTHKVYIEFPRRIDQGEAPPLFVVGPEGGAELVNYRLRGNYYIVDRLFAAAELRLGEDPQQVVRINRTDGRQASGGPTETLSGPEVR